MRRASRFFATNRNVTEVAMDVEPLSELERAEGSLYFGADSTLSPGTYFYGLMDDVRIYNRIVSP